MKRMKRMKHLKHLVGLWLDSVLFYKKVRLTKS